MKRSNTVSPRSNGSSPLLVNGSGAVPTMLHSNGTTNTNQNNHHNMNGNYMNLQHSNSNNGPMNHRVTLSAAKDTTYSTTEERHGRDSVQFKNGSASGKIQQSSTTRRGGFSVGHGSTSSNPSFSLPPELKKILYEVAKTGKCTSLPWTASEINSFNAKRSQEYHRAAKRKKHGHKDNVTIKSDRSSSSRRDALTPATTTATTTNTTNTSSTTASIVKWESNSNIDDSSVKSYSSKLDTTSSRKTDHQMDHASSVAPSHADSSSVVETASLASQSSKRSVDLSITATAQNDIRRRRFFRDQSYASSCSESVSSAGGGSTLSVPSSSASMGPLCLSLPFRTLRGALRLAVALVLEYSYKHRGGYKLSPAEKRRFEVLANSNSKLSSSYTTGKITSTSSYHPSRTDIAFMERRMRLLKTLGGGKSAHAPATRFANGMHFGNGSDGGFTSDTSIDASIKRKNASEEYAHSSSFGPPFTIQRVAEVLLAPERYYLQTHKLCNALEKLLLVTLPSSAFGGGTGGDTSQSRREEQEIAALADKKEKDESEQRMRKHELKRRISSSSYDGGDPIIEMNVSVETPESKKQMSNIKTSKSTSEQDRRSTNRILGDSQGSSLPLSVSMYQPGAVGQSQGGFNARSSDSYPSSVVNQDNDSVQRDLQVADPLSNALYQTTSQGLNPLMNNHHMEIVIGQGGATASSGDVPYLDQMDAGRFSASNSDIDSESDDISFDDSASDRSDGSDFESTILGVGLSEPFTAARVMALNRVQQQHRREQYLQDRASRQVTTSGTTSNFQSIADFEYQSGDSIDSNMAEDSCGSDSSSQGDFTD